MTSWFAAGVGAVQVGSSTVRARRERPPISGIGDPREGKTFARIIGRGFKPKLEAPPVYGLVRCLDADRRAAKDRDRDTSARPTAAAVGHSQGQGDHLVFRRCSRRRPGRIFCSRVTERPHIGGGGPQASSARERRHSETMAASSDKPCPPATVAVLHCRRC